MFAVRFLLLLLCLSLSPPRCSSLTEAASLLTFKKSLSNPQSLSSWKPDSQPCQDKWVGIFCSNEKQSVMRIHLPAMGLSGTVDVDALNQLPELRAINLVNNSFTSPLPPFNKLIHLRVLYLKGNKFSGEIPPDFFSTVLALKKLWLSNNQLSGKIPDSLGKLTNLQQLHLENNKFSGPIPDISQKSLNDLNFSNNNLEGEIPTSMTRFGAKAFNGNAGVCGALTGTDCQAVKKTKSSEAAAAKADQIAQSNPSDQSPPSNDKGKSGGGSTKTTVGVVMGLLGVVAVLLLLTTARKSRRKDGDFSVLGKEPMDDVVEVHVHGSRAGSTKARKGGSLGREGGGSSRKSADGSHRNKDENSCRKGSQNGKNGIGDLVVINNEKGVFGLADLMKAAAEVLGNGGLGSAYKAMMANGVSVVVKRIREMSKLGKEEFDAQIRKIASIRHPNILAPLAYHYRKEEKLVVSEYVSKGSLLYVLHGDRGSSHAELNWPARLKIIKGISNGMRHLHSEFRSLELPHGNLKSSNVLLNDRYEPLLSDYAFISLVDNNQATQGMFAFKVPEVAAAAAESQQPISPKCDVYCLGIVILEILTGKFPSQYLSAGKGGTDVIQWVRTAINDKNEAEFLDPEVASCTESIGEMVRLLHIGAACTETNPDRRPGMDVVVKRIEEIKEV
ncbi:Pollen receptor-like kinase 3 [Ancistrocladus abbreviatus]